MYICSQFSKMNRLSSQYYYSTLNFHKQAIHTILYKLWISDFRKTRSHYGVKGASLTPTKAFGPITGQFNQLLSTVLCFCPALTFLESNAIIITGSIPEGGEIFDQCMGSLAVQHRQELGQLLTTTAGGLNVLTTRHP